MPQVTGLVGSINCKSPNLTLQTVSFSQHLSDTMFCAAKAAQVKT